jgi:hypothetical protein
MPTVKSIRSVIPSHMWPVFTTGGGGVLQNIDYSYDNVGNINKTENQPFITRDATSRSVVQE